MLLPDVAANLKARIEKQRLTLPVQLTRSIVKQLEELDDNGKHVLNVQASQNADCLRDAQS